MPQQNSGEHKCSHHTGAPKRPQKWYKVHFSGKVIMCSVLFGLGLVLVGGLIMAIGMDQSEDKEPEKKNDDVQNKAPMSVVGPVIMGIGSFTVIVGVVMCLFETNICRKGRPDTRPLIEEQTASGTSSRATDHISVPSQKREKHRHRRKSPSPRRGKSRSPRDKSSPEVISPSSKPIDVQRNSPRGFTASDKFMTPSSSFVSENIPRKENASDAINQTSSVLTSSGKSWTTSSEFRTPPSSLQDSCGSFEANKVSLKINSESPDSKELMHSKMNDVKHAFLTPQNSNDVNLDDGSPNEIGNSSIAIEDMRKNINTQLLNPEKENATNHDFITPMNSYVQDSIVSNLNGKSFEINHVAKIESNPVPLEKLVDFPSTDIAIDQSALIAKQNGIDFPPKEIVTDQSALIAKQNSVEIANNENQNDCNQNGLMEEAVNKQKETAVNENLADGAKDSNEAPIKNDLNLENKSVEVLENRSSDSLQKPEAENS